MLTVTLFVQHHITTGEGGVVVCHTQEDADLLRCLRAHGYSSLPLHSFPTVSSLVFVMMIVALR
jgi:dTDP-4-amino-4,6-dideoxygalactose transaminase